ncbi:MAG: hypothetical protein IH627_07540 [Rubrivivax sp.]|nr:hypothetical protein [Rubrivivax sp.]
MKRSLIRLFLSMSAAVLLMAACGGGADVDTSRAQGFVAQIAAAQPSAADARKRALAAAEITLDAAAAFDWAEYTYPDLFPKVPAPVNLPLEYESVQYTVRMYANGNNLGVTPGNDIYGLGPFTNEALKLLGNLSEFAAQIRADACSVHPGSCDADRANQLFDWAEYTYPALFPKGPRNADVVRDGVDYVERAYTNGNALRMARGSADPAVYGFGPFTDDVLVSFGKWSDFAALVTLPINPSPLAAPGRLNAQVPGTQDYVSTARLANGDMIVVWQSPHAEFAGEFSPPRRVMLQRLDSAGDKAGPEAQIHLNPDFSPGNNAAYLFPEVTALDGGGYAVVFVDNPTYSPASPRLRIKFFDADDTQTADTIIPNPQLEVSPGRWVTTYHDSTGEVVPVALEGGGLAVVWSAGYTGSLGQYAGQTTNYVQRLDADGALDGAAVRFTPWVASVSYSQDFHDWVNDAAPLPGGGFVVLYRGGKETAGNDTAKPVIMAQTFGADGQPDAEPFVIKAPTVANNFSQYDARFAALEGGGSVVIWRAANVGIEGQRFDDDFNPVGPAFAAMPANVGGGRSTVSATPYGGFIVTTLQDIYTVKAQRFDADGVALSEPSVVASRTLYPGVSSFGGNYGNAPGWWEFAPDGTGHFFIVGNSFSAVDHADVWMQRFRARWSANASSSG